MKMRKILSLLMVISLMLLLCSSVFADAEDKSTDKPGTITYDISSKVNLPVFNLTIQKPAGVIVNPFGMPVNIPWGSGGSTSETAFSVPRLITNSSDIPVKVTATPTVKVPSAVEVSSTESIADGKTAIFLKLSMANASTSTIDDYTGINKTGGATDYTNSDFAVFTQKESGQSFTCSISLPKGDSASTYGAYLVSGKSTPGDWASNDTVEMTLLFDVKADLPQA